MRYTIYLCEKCGHVYDSSLGDQKFFLRPHHEMSEVRLLWRCPDCRASGLRLAEFMVRDVTGDIITEQIGSESPLMRLLKIAHENQWCTSFYCTTCGARPFRNALGMLPRGSLIRYLKELPEDLCWSGAFKIIVTDIGVLPWGGDLLDELDGTPAASVIRNYIQTANERHQKYLAYIETQTPEAIAQRRLERANAKKPHRDRSDIRNSAMRLTGEYLAAVQTKDLLTVVVKKTFEVPIRALGGYLYQRLSVHYQKNNPTESDRALMTLLASSHGGHWAKLADKFCLL